MRKTWIFLKLRLLQLRSDKSALFFCYVLPVLLLLGIGYPQQIKSKPSIELAYADLARSETSAAFVRGLQSNVLVELKPYARPEGPATQALENNDIKHYLEVRGDPAAGGGLVAHLYGNSLPENRVENTAIRAIVDESLSAVHASAAQIREVPTRRDTSYVVTLLPGVIGMTLLIIGLSGFGAVLIEEEHHGLYKNIKSIDASPLPFLAGLFLSRLLVAYSVAAAMLLIGILVFDVPATFNYALLLSVVTLGSMAFLGLGMLLAVLSPSVTAFNGIISFVQIPLIILGGVFFSVNAFPQWLQSFARLLPLTQFNSALRELLFGSVGFQNVALLGTEIAGLGAWCVGTLALARLRFRW